MEWLWFVGGLFLVFLGTLFVVGVCLPRDHLATRSLVVPCPRAEAWSILRDVAQVPTWRHSVTRVDGITGDPAAPLAWVEHSGRDALPFSLEECEQGRRFVTRITNDRLPFGGTWTFELTDEGEGTRVRITERGFVKPPPFRVIARYMIGHARTIEGYLRDLTAKTGSEACIEA